MATRYARCRAFAPGHGFWFNSLLVSLDSTTISLGLRLFPWARFRSANGAVKVHTLLDHGGNIPAFVVLTAGQPSAITVTRKRRLPRDSLVTMARGALD